MEIVVPERYQDIILARMETFYSSTCISTLIVFEFLISFLNVCIFTDNNNNNINNNNNNNNDNEKTLLTNS